MWRAGKSAVSVDHHCAVGWCGHHERGDAILVCASVDVLVIGQGCCRERDVFKPSGAVAPRGWVNFRQQARMAYLLVAAHGGCVGAKANQVIAEVDGYFAIGIAGNARDVY